MSTVEILQNEVNKLQKRLKALEGFERPRAGKDMTADRIRRINDRIQQYHDMISANSGNDSPIAKYTRQQPPTRQGQHQQ